LGELLQRKMRDSFSQTLMMIRRGHVQLMEGFELIFYC